MQVWHVNEDINLALIWEKVSLETQIKRKTLIRYYHMTNMYIRGAILPEGWIWNQHPGGSHSLVFQKHKIQGTEISGSASILRVPRTQINSRFNWSIQNLTALHFLFFFDFLWDMNITKWCNGFYIKFRQSFAKETFSYDEHLKS